MMRSKREDLPRYTYQPEIVVESLAELADLMDRNHWRPSWRHAIRREAVAV